jgi:hypothetical protein
LIIAADHASVPTQGDTDSFASRERLEDLGTTRAIVFHNMLTTQRYLALSQEAVICFIV